MATTRFFSKDGLRIIDEHDDGRNFFYFIDRRLDGFPVRRANGTSFLATSAQSIPSYNTGNTEADKDLIADGGTVIDGGLMGSVRRKRWDRIMILEWFMWPGVEALEATWTTENNPAKKQGVKGICMSWGVPAAQAQTIADNFIPGDTKPAQSDMGGIAMPATLRDIMDVTDMDDTSDLSVKIESWRTGPRKNSILKAFYSMMLLRDSGWTRLWVHIDYDGFMRATLGRGTPETSWEYQHFFGETDVVARDIKKVADKMYLCAKGAEDAA